MMTAITSAPVQKVLNPTLFLAASDYDNITEKRIESEKYLLLYAYRYNPTMTDYAEKLAKKNGWKIIDISHGEQMQFRRPFVIYFAVR